MQLYGLDGHFERECDLRSILDRIKDYEHRLLERRNRTLSGQVHHLEEPPHLFKQDHDSDNFELEDQVVESCLFSRTQPARDTLTNHLLVPRLRSHSPCIWRSICLFIHSPN